MTVEASVGFKLFLALGMLVAGSFNTIAVKLADNEHSVGIADGVNPKDHLFDHPIFQSLTMFIGELSCLVVFTILSCMGKITPEVTDTPKPTLNPLIFLPPAMMDMTGTSLMYIGLTKTYASVFQMLRGAVVIFTGILSCVVLKRKLMNYHWSGMVLVLVGLSMVGVASVITPDSSASASDPITGDILVIMAQFVVSIQMVYEERFIGRYQVPALQAVGWEGYWGCVVCLTVLVLMQYIPDNINPADMDKCMNFTAPCGKIGGVAENSVDALEQLKNNSTITICLVGVVISIAFFNYFGISVTKTMSATTRMVLDSLRTVVIWVASIALGLETFSATAGGFIQLGGFVVLLGGICVYNEIIKLPCFRYGTPGERLLEDVDGLNTSYNAGSPKPISNYDNDDTTGRRFSMSK